MRIPGIIDLLRVNDAKSVLALANDDRLDRGYERTGPLLNRVIAGRVRRVLQLGGVPLPPVSPRALPGRAERQAQLEAMLAPQSGQAPTDGVHLDELAACVLGRRPQDALGPLVQETVGRLFVPDYRGTTETWEAAKLLDAAVRSFNPLRQLLWAVTGRITQARALLAERVAGDRAALHTTGIAVHNLVQGFEQMRELASDAARMRRTTREEALARCLIPPATVLRQAVRPGAIPAGELRAGTLVTFGLKAAHEKTLRRDVAFMTESWSRCPAHAWVPALIGAVWDRAAAMRRAEAGAAE